VTTCDPDECVGGRHYVGDVPSTAIIHRRCEFLGRPRPTIPPLPGHLPGDAPIHDITTLKENAT